MPTIGEKLKELRIQKGLSVSSISQATGINRLTLYEYERNEVHPALANLQRLCKFLKVSLKEFDDCQVFYDTRFVTCPRQKRTPVTT